VSTPLGRFPEEFFDTLVELARHGQLRGCGDWVRGCSCEPNMFVQSVMWNQADLSLHYVCLFSQEVIYPGASLPPSPLSAWVTQQVTAQRSRVLSKRFSGRNPELEDFAHRT
jgi:hypothetical protein